MTSMKDLAGLMFGGLEDPLPVHFVCTLCHPVRVAGSQALCGFRFQEPPRAPDPGQHRCAKCLSLRDAEWPCGH